jgi:hypothetical protein
MGGGWVQEGGGKKTWVFLMVSSRLHPGLVGNPTCEGMDASVTCRPSAK